MDDELHRRVAVRIRALAKAKGLPLSHLADRAGVSRSHFWEVLRCGRSPTLSWLNEVAKVLEVDVVALLSTNESGADGQRRVGGRVRPGEP